MYDTEKSATTQDSSKKDLTQYQYHPESRKRNGEPLKPAVDPRDPFNPFFDFYSTHDDSGEASTTEGEQKTDWTVISQGEPAGYLKVTKGADARIWRHAVNVADKKVRDNVSEDKKALPEGTVLAYYKVKGEETTKGRYYVSHNSHVGWINASAVTNIDGPESESMGTSPDVNPRTINYKQYDNRWGKTKYGRYSDYSHGGCGPTSMANIAVQFGHGDVTPVTMGEMSVKFGTRCAKGTDGFTFFKKASEALGLSVQHYVKRDVKKGLESMKGISGKYAIVHVNSSKWGGGHFMTLYGYDGKNVYIDDPNTWNEKDVASNFISKDIQNGLWVFG